MKNNEQMELMKLEYEKAQDSAEHYNQMIWVLIPTFLAFIFFIVVNYDTLNFPFFEKPGLIMLAAFALLGMHILVDGAHEKKILKYSICKIIEERENMIGHNLLVTQLDKHKKSRAMNFIRAVRKIIIFLLTIWSLQVLINSLASMDCMKIFVAIIVFIVVAYISYLEVTDKPADEKEIVKILEERLKKIYPKK